MIRVLIADDHPIVRQGLKRILLEEFEKPILAEAQNCQEVIELVQNHDWDAVIPDISMPARGGLEVLRELTQTRPRLPVVILSVHPKEQYAVRALRAGAAG